jgi:hypothetical protein
VKTELDTIRLRVPEIGPVNRARLARYLELPSLAQLDPITDSEIRKLDARRDEMLSPWRLAICAAIDRIDVSEAFGRRLIERDADAVVVVAFTIGPCVDEIIKSNLDRDEIYEAFVLKQWAATMTEQMRAEITRAARDWAEQRGRSLMPYDGPGYNGWPLESMRSLLEMLYKAAGFEAARALRATEQGVLLPTNSMLIVHGLAPRHSETISRRDESLAQCHRCAMRNCGYRITEAGLK